MKVKTGALGFVLFLVLSQLSACRMAIWPQQGDGVPQHGVVHGKSDALSEAAILDLRDTVTLRSIADDLADARVIYVGESHDNYAHHLKQLEVIQQLHAADSDLAIGMEQFQQPFQGILDEYIAGQVDEKELLRGSGWYDRWRFDFRLYRPILSFARANRIPVIALNLPREITNKVSRKGLEGLTPEERSRIPASLDDSDPAYRARLREAFEQHPNAGRRKFERFLQVQLLWDEGMAERVAEYLENHPGRKMVVLAGSGHLLYGQGIPKRVTRRISDPSRIILPAEGVNLESGIGDFLLFTGKEELPAAGKLGVLLEEEEQGVLVVAVQPASGAEEAEMEAGDYILAMDGAPVKTVADIRIESLDRKPGERILVTVKRKGLQESLDLEVVLGE